MISGLVVLLAATAGAVLAAEHSDSAAPAAEPFGSDPRDLLPNLVTAPVRDLYTQHLASSRMLRFTHEIVNVGHGPLEIHPLAPGSCTSPRSAGTTYQGQEWLYRDTNGDGRFERGVDRPASRKVVACLIYHQAHHHWHIDDFVSYELYRPFETKPVRTSGKVSFCVVDTARERPDLPGSPEASYFQVLDRLPGDCKRGTTIGLSVGYGDLYRANLVDQWIDITGLPGGVYCLVTRTDVHDFIPEEDENDNDRRTPIRITDTGAHILSGRECPA